MGDAKKAERAFEKLILVGCGAVAERYHGPVLQQLQQRGAVRVVGLCDPDPRRRAALAAMFPHATTAIAPEELGQAADAALVLSPPRFHAAQTLALLARGLHVFCEKPMSVSEAEAQAMTTAAERAGRVLTVGLFRRFFPACEQVRDVIRGGVLGAPWRIDWTEGGVFNWPTASASFFDPQSSPGGVFADVGSHVLDLLLWWLGEPVAFDYEDDAMGGLEANAKCVLRFDRGAVATVRLSRDTALRTGVRIVFEGGEISMQGGDPDFMGLKINGSQQRWRGRVQGEAEDMAAPRQGPTRALTAQLENFIGAVRGTEQTRVGAGEAARVQRWIERGYTERRLMAQPWLSSGEARVATELAGRSRG